MSDKTYNILKSIAQIWLPAIATFYISLARIWNLPYPEEVGGTIIAIDTLLGCILGISSDLYYKKKDEELKEKLMGELMDYSHRELTHSSLETIDKLAHALKNVCKIELMCQDSPIETYEESGKEVVSALKAVIDKIENM